MYQKVTGLILAIGMVFCLTACGQVAEIENPDTGVDVDSESGMASSPESEPESSSESDPIAENSDEWLDEKILVAYFSWSGNTEEMGFVYCRADGRRTVGNPTGKAISYRLQ